MFFDAMTVLHEIFGGVKVVLRTLFGLAVSVTSGFFLHRAFHQAPFAETFALVCMAGIFLGALIMAPSVVSSAAKQIVVLLPFDIKVGGRRKTDPKAPPGAEGE